VELWADDGQGHNVSISITMTVTENQAPWLILPRALGVLQRDLHPHARKVRTTTRTH